MSNRFMIVAIVSGLLLTGAGLLFPQTPREMSPGTWVSGKLREGEEHWFSVRPVNAGILTLETSGDLDTYIEGYDASRSLIGEDDDGGEGYNARLSIFAEANRTYLFKLRGYDEDEGGSYRIWASSGSVRELLPGSEISGTLSENEEQWFSVRSTDNGIMIIETSGNTDTRIKAYDSSLSEIGEDDDSGEDFNARLEIFTEMNKVYYFRLNAYDDDNGNYGILATYEPLPPDLERNTERSRAAALKLGEPNPVYLLSPGESRWYRYDIPRAGTLFVVQSRGSMDTTMALYDAEGKMISEDDDSGEGANALISEKIGPGTVYIEVNEYEGQMGRCTLHAEFR